MSKDVIIYSDLDGTLLDHDTYRFDAAQAALDQIKKSEIPLILCSSKTAPEIVALQQAIGLDQPFIAENGAGVYLMGEDNAWFCKEFAISREHVNGRLNELRNLGFRFSGFNDWGPEGIAEATGLPLSDAILASRRDFSEPIRWEDTEEQLNLFLKELKTRGLTAAQGGRFLTIAGESDKGTAMQWLTETLTDREHATVIALGDSPNDVSMLNAADIAIVIRSDRSDSLHIQGPHTTIRTRKRGPAGWADALLPVLEEL